MLKKKDSTKSKAKINGEKKGILEKIGFTSDESLMYMALLQLGPSSMSDVVRKTGLHRPTAYKTVESLIEKRMVSIMPKGKWNVYIAESPDKLEKIFQELEDDFNVEIHSLHESYSALGKKPLVKYAEGDGAIREVFSDVVGSLKKNDVYYRYSSALTLVRRKFVPKDYKEIRDRKSLERHIITDEPSRSLMKRKLGKGVKFIPKDFELFDLNITQIVYGNKVALLDYNTKTTIVIENEMIAEFQKRIFKLLYGML